MAERQDAIYVVGDSDHERQRLQNQADFVYPFTRRLFENAAITPGMRVLDVGTGMGDTALLLAEMVGPEGTVLGVDKNADILAQAQQRMPANVTLRAGDIRDIEIDEEFDAIVGRCVLQYQQDPAATIASAIRTLRPGGIVAFLEPDFTTASGVGVPQPPLLIKVRDIFIETWRRAKIELHMGFKLRQTFLAAGLPEPQLQVDAPIGGGKGWAGYHNMEAIMRSMLPYIESLGVATAEEIEVDTLAARMEAEVVALNSTIMTSMWIGAWARKP